MSALKPRIAFLPPPGAIVLTARNRSASSSPTIPQIFRDALSIRLAVFVEEQHVPLDNEIDVEDALSWHWVLYARKEGEEEEEEEEDIPAATVRLVPPVADEMDRCGRERKYEADVKAREAEGKGDEKAEAPNYGVSELWDGTEPYFRISRLATLVKFRRRGYGELLMEEALKWMGSHREEFKEGSGWEGLVLVHAQKGVEGWYKRRGFERDKGVEVWWEEGIEHVEMWRRA